jgi:hypothetical protein
MMLISEIESTKPLDASQTQNRALDQQQKQINLAKKNLQLKKARERQKKIASQITKLKSTD